MEQNQTSRKGKKIIIAEFHFRNDYFLFYILDRFNCSYHAMLYLFPLNLGKKGCYGNRDVCKHKQRKRKERLDFLKCGAVDMFPFAYTADHSHTEKCQVNSTYRKGYLHQYIVNIKRSDHHSITQSKCIYNNSQNRCDKSRCYGRFRWSCSYERRYLYC